MVKESFHGWDRDRERLNTSYWSTNEPWCKGEKDYAAPRSSQISLHCCSQKGVKVQWFCWPGYRSLTQVVGIRRLGIWGRDPLQCCKSFRGQKLTLSNVTSHSCSCCGKKEKVPEVVFQDSCDLKYFCCLSKHWKYGDKCISELIYYQHNRKYATSLYTK